MKLPKPRNREPQTGTGPGLFADRTLDKWIGVNHGDGDFPGPVSSVGSGADDEWDGERRKFASPWTRARRFALNLTLRLLGLPAAPPTEPVPHLSEYVIDIIGWCVIAAICAALVYLVYHGLNLFGIIR